MDSSYSFKKNISVIIPAYNEAKTIKAIVETARQHVFVSEVIVVDDGSTDKTAEIAEKVGAKVIKQRNQGKAKALVTGVEHARNETLFFMDADLIGMTTTIMDRAIVPVLSKQSDMYALTIDRNSVRLKKMLTHMPLLAGTRVLTKKIWHLVPHKYQIGYQIEVALNFFTRKAGYQIGSEVIPGLKQIIKEKKRGVFLGSIQRFKMIIDLVSISIELYFVEVVLSYLKNIFIIRPKVFLQRLFLLN